MKMPTCLVRCLATVASLVLWLSACGGGVGAGGTGTYAAGPITGFGSIFVNAIRFDDSGAAVVDDEGLARDRSTLKLGMTVEVEAGALTGSGDGAAAQATQIRVGSSVVGPVQALDVQAGTLTVLGQTVLVAVDTVFDDRLGQGLASLSIGQTVEVYAQFDVARDRFDATRIEPRVGVAVWRLRAQASQVDPVNRTIVIGAGRFAYAGATGVPSGLAAGQPVLLRLSGAVDTVGRYVVSAFGVAQRLPQDRDEARLRGRITALDSAQRFDVDGVPVEASGASFPDGTAGLAVGARVEVRGPTAAGTVQATLVKVESDDDVRERGFEIEGEIGAVDPVAMTFRLRGLTVSYARPDLRVDDGTLAELAPGRRVEVRAQLAADRIGLEATRIKFE